MRTPDTRIRGLDVARGIAVLGMFTAHTISVSDPEGGFVVLDELAGGTRPRMLFALVGGISLGLLVARAPVASRAQRMEIRRQIAIRGLALFGLGLLLQLFFSGVSIVIDEWGLLFLLMVPLLFVRTAWLLGGAAVLVVAGTIAIVAGVGPTPDGSGDEAEVTRVVVSQSLSWLFTGSYPLVTWLPSIAAGYVLARCDLTRAATQAWMSAAGSAVFIVGLVIATLVDPAGALATWPAALATQLSALGLAAALVGILVWATSNRLGGVGRMFGRILYPLAAAGAMPLTVYTVHVLVLAAWYVIDPAGWAPDATTWTIFTIVTLVLAPLWRLTLGQGPLERVLAILSGRRADAPRAR
jgi:uncharacterized membrane protein YeiB